MLKIRVQHKNGLFNRRYNLELPGATLGRSPNNQIVLPDPAASVSLFQAVLTVSSDSEITIRNLATTPILIDSQTLSVGQSSNLMPNSAFSCGDFTFAIEAEESASEPAASKVEEVKTKAHDSTLVSTQSAPLDTPAKAPTVMPMPGTTPIMDDMVAANTSDGLTTTAEGVAPIQPEQPSKAEVIDSSELVQAETSFEVSIFDDLFSGTGVVPIGTEFDAANTHPFDAVSASSRNTHDPLGQLHGIALDEDLSKDPLERLNKDGLEQQQRDIFSDTRPSTLLHDHPDDKDKEHFAELDKIFEELEAYGKS